MPVFERWVDLAAAPEEVLRWHQAPGAFERLAPPWDDVRVISRTGGIEPGARVVLSMPTGVWGRRSVRSRHSPHGTGDGLRPASEPDGPLRQRWVAEHRALDVAGVLGFRDVQVSGPFAAWDHRHLIEARPGGGARLVDRIEYALPLGALGAAAGGRFARGQLERVFRYRHRVLADDLAAHAATRGRPAMRIAITGASGMIGQALAPLLETGGHQVVRLVRGRAARENEIAWDPARGTLDASALRGIDAVVHLAGENVAAGRWTEARKRALRDSRTLPTATLAGALASVEGGPRTLVCASAIGVYGDRGDEELVETSPLGADFLADLGRAWEDSTAAAARAGVRVVHLRFGIVLSPRGGALAKMLTPYSLGLGGPLGSGRQWMSWVAIDDTIGAIQHALVTDSLAGAVNVTAPSPVRNSEFTRGLGRVLGRPTPFPAPAFALKLAFGEMAGALLLGSQRVLPAKLLASGYRFRFAELEPALRHVLGRA
jgi:hypothetical protein